MRIATNEFIEALTARMEKNMNAKNLNEQLFDMSERVEYLEDHEN